MYKGAIVNKKAAGEKVAQRTTRCAVEKYKEKRSRKENTANETGGKFYQGQTRTYDKRTRGYFGKMDETLSGRFESRKNNK